MNRVAAVVFFAASLTGAVVSSADEMPHVAGQTLANKQIDFPSACAGFVCIIVIGFSHGSQPQAKAWTDRANTEFHNDRNVAIYSMAVLEDAPRLVRGMAVQGIKSGVPDGQHDRFAIVYQGEATLKRVAGFRKTDDAYILLLDRTGNIKWATSGPVTDTLFADLKNYVSSMGQMKRPG
jgi:hypothetical protein